MAYVAVSNSPIHVRQTAGPIDPGFGQGGDYPSHQPVFPGGPIDPGYDRPAIGPIDPGFGVGLPPIASHPLPPAPVHPGNRPPGSGHYPSGQPLPPTYPVDPGYDIPNPPNIWPQPPRPEGPDSGYDKPIAIRPDLPIYLPPSGPDNELPMPPGSVWPPLPPGVTEQVLCLVWIVGVGYRWTVIDPSLSAGYPLVPPPAYPSNRPPGSGDGNHPSGQPIPGGGHPSGQPVPPVPAPNQPAAKP